MSFFTWKDNGLTSDCSSLDAMASRFEETANLMKKLSKKGFKLKKTHNNQLILHNDPKVFDLIHSLTCFSAIPTCFEAAK